MNSCIRIGWRKGRNDFLANRFGMRESGVCSDQGVFFFFFLILLRVDFSLSFCFLSHATFCLCLKNDIRGKCHPAMLFQLMHAANPSNFHPANAASIVRCPVYYVFCSFVFLLQASHFCTIQGFKERERERFIQILSKYLEKGNEKKIWLDKKKTR